MYFKRLVVEGMRSLTERQEFSFSRGLNYIVGNNNLGKSTIFEAINWLTEGGQKIGESASRGGSGVVRVEALFAGEGLEVIRTDDQFVRLRDYLFDDDGELALRVERSNEERTVTQGNRQVALDGKKACFWHPEREQFENPNGIDANFRALLDVETIWADAHPSDHVDFASTKTLGRLIARAMGQLTDSESWIALEAAHKAVFESDTEESASAKASQLAADIGAIVRDQYGEAPARFEFKLLEPAQFLRNGTLHVDDGHEETPLSAKGLGMQRAFALAMILVLARSESKDSSQERPLFLLIDEPETWLHPTAQLRLGEALGALAAAQQLFLITHSPYFIRHFDPTTHQLLVVRLREQKRVWESRAALGPASDTGPSWGEINYVAFDIPSQDYLDELYGSLIQRVPSSSTNPREHEIDAFLVSKGLAQSKMWQRDTPGSVPLAVTLPVFARNSIHHPENPLNPSLTQDELGDAISQLLQVAHTA